MQAKVVRVSERVNVGAFGPAQKSLLIQYMVDNHGPFTLETTQEELDNGTATRKMQTFADTLGRL
jgi:hypothetical protein